MRINSKRLRKIFLMFGYGIIIILIFSLNLLWLTKIFNIEASIFFFIPACWLESVILYCFIYLILRLCYYLFSPNEKFGNFDEFLNYISEKKDYYLVDKFIEVNFEEGEKNEEKNI